VSGIAARRIVARMARLELWAHRAIDHLPCYAMNRLRFSINSDLRVAPWQSMTLPFPAGIRSARSINTRPKTHLNGRLPVGISAVLHRAFPATGFPAPLINAPLRDVERLTTNRARSLNRALGLARIRACHLMTSLSGLWGGATAGSVGALPGHFVSIVPLCSERLGVFA
jgi:hypothetical protein